MSLDWNATNVENYEEITTDEEWVVTEAIIFGTMAIDMGEITEANWQEFYARTAMFESLFGAFISAPVYETTTVSDLSTGDYFRSQDIDDNRLQVALEDGQFARYHYRQFTGPDTPNYEGEPYSLPSEKTVEKHSGFEKTPITPEQVKRRIGLTTNVATRTRHQFVKRMGQNFLEERERHAKHYAERVTT